MTSRHVRGRARPVGPVTVARLAGGALLAALVAGCASDDEQPEDADPTVEVGEADDDAFVRTTDDATGSTGDVADAGVRVSITEIDVRSGRLTITNHGADDVDLGAVWICVAADCRPIADQSLSGAHSVTVDDPHASMPDDGELLLARTDEVDGPEAVLSYVEWGSPGHPLSSVAVEAGLWGREAVAPGTVLGTGGEFATDAAAWSVLGPLTATPTPTPEAGTDGSSPPPPPPPPASDGTPPPSTAAPPPDDYGGSTVAPTNAPTTAPAGTTPSTEPPPPPDDYAPPAPQPPPASPPPASPPPAPPPPDEY